MRSCFGALHQREAVPIPQCEGIDPDLGARCPERTYDRLCEGCRECPHCGDKASHDSLAPDVCPLYEQFIDQVVTA
ncbi:MAG: hypothetical protein NUW01_02305 [Gemmatimonadaceae bacterium]|nr:hypothetical protein [Gemmatimonadaceae bacterium]